MRMKSLMSALLPRLAKTPSKCSDQAKADIAPRVVQQYACGSLSLALGRYVTAADLDTCNERLARHAYGEQAQ